LAQPIITKQMRATFNGNDSVLVSYKGAVTEDLITNLLQYLDAKFVQLKASSRIKRKIISVLVEALENIFWHGHQPIGRPDSEVSVYEENGSYLVVTGNRVEARKAHELKDRIELLNTLSAEELNANYRHILEHKIKSSPNGSGVGMIDMLRRSGNQIQLQMEKLDEEFYFVTMQIKVAE